ncbi:MAG: hypothetical protein GY895_03390, partial [Phycisphaera sp.]|nr:hypothetical protein [Phycisphaera sp.]
MASSGRGRQHEHGGLLGTHGIESAAPDEPLGSDPSIESSRPEIRRIQEAIDRLVVGGGGLDRQDRLLARWRARTASDLEQGDDDRVPGGRSVNEAAFIEPDDDSAHGRGDGLETQVVELERISTGCAAVDAGIGGGLIRHGMHEWLGDPFAVSGEAGGDRNVREWVPCLGPVIGMLHRLRNEHDDRGRSSPNITWIGRRCLPGPWNLVSGRLDAIGGSHGAPMTRRGDDGMRNPLRSHPGDVDARLLDRSIFILPDEDDRASRRWCLEAAIRTPAIDAVIVDGNAFDALDSRRIQLGLLERRRRGESAILVMVVRPPGDVRIRSSASTRWLIEPVPTRRHSPSVEIGPIRDSRRWRLRLLRCRMPQAAPIEGDPLEGIVSDDWPIGDAGRRDTVQARDRAAIGSSIEKEADASK